MGNNDKTGTESKDITKRLDVIINLLIRQLEKDKKLTMRDRITLLKNTGIRNTEIAKILGISEGHVNKELSLMRKSKK